MPILSIDTNSLTFEQARRLATLGNQPENKSAHRNFTAMGKGRDNSF